MESPRLEHQGAKRKHSPVDDTARKLPPPAIPQGNFTQINYLMKAKAERLRLIDGDLETFGDVLGMIDDYEGVLQRHESLAANLGAKLVGPLLLKSFEKLFDGHIKVIQASYSMEQSPITWLDIVALATLKSSEFVLSEPGSGIKACRFWIKGGQVEISEDDYRLIMSGAPERMIPTQPITEDESAELETLNILETRLTMLIKKADAVASKARQLNYHVKGRKTSIMARKAAGIPGSSNEECRTYSPQPFSAINARPSGRMNEEGAKLQQELLELFLSNERRTSVSHHRPKASRIPTSDSLILPFNGSQHDASDRRMSHPLTASEDGSEGQHRVLMASKIEKLRRGDVITPPCDRCRRLKFECTKHLTACSACTKKHAKCSWKDLKETDLDTPTHPLQVSVSQPLPIHDQEHDGLSNATTIDWDPDSKSRPESSGVVGPNEHPPSRENPAEVQSILEHGNGERRDNSSSEHVVLTQIASAAAAAGTS